MILPTKHIPEEQALLGVGAILLEYMHEPKSVSRLWENVKRHPSIGTYQRFILGLDMLFILGLIVFKNGKTERIQ